MSEGVNNLKIGLDMNLSGLTNYYTKQESDSRYQATESAISNTTQTALNLKADKNDVWTRSQSNILSANVSTPAASLSDNY